MNELRILGACQCGQGGAFSFSDGSCSCDATPSERSQTKTLVRDLGGFNFRPVTSGRFNVWNWALFTTTDGEGVCEYNTDSPGDSVVVFMPGTKEVLEVSSSLVTNPHAAAESWSEDMVNPIFREDEEGNSVLICANHMVARHDDRCCECGYGY